MKVLDSNNFSKKEIKDYSSLYEFLLGPFRFEGFSTDCYSISNLIHAINLLSSQEIEQISIYLNQEKLNSKKWNSAICKLRTLKFRVLYDSQIINSIHRATDYQNYDPLIVLGFVKLYDAFSGCSYNPKISKEFIISDIESILDLLPSAISDVIDLNFGLLDGYSLSEKDISKQLGISIKTLRIIKKEGLTLLKNYY